MNYQKRNKEKPLKNKQTNLYFLTNKPQINEYLVLGLGP